MSIKALRKANADMKSKVKSAIEKEVEGKKDYANDDPRFWFPQTDKEGSSSTIIRFLPQKNLTELPYVKVFSHGFQGSTGRWYIENCPTTLPGEHACPACEHNASRAKSHGKQACDKRWRRTHYIANILIIKDAANPQNEGRVALYKFGKKIFNKITDAAAEDEDIEAIEPFSLFEGANFRLKLGKVEGQNNYDQSRFLTASELFDGDEEKLEELLEKLFDLSEFISPANFKSYDELKIALVRACADEMDGPDVEDDAEEEEEEEVVEKRPVKKAAASATKKAPAKKVVEEDDEDEEEEDDNIDSLLEELDDDDE